MAFYWCDHAHLGISIRNVNVKFGAILKVTLNQFIILAVDILFRGMLAGDERPTTTTLETDIVLVQSVRTKYDVNEKHLQ